MKNYRNRIIATLIASSMACTSVASDRKPEVINDLRYGEALFNFYQGRYFSSITNLMVAKERKPITEQNIDPELLLGGLYLYYGLHQEASTIFNELIKHTSQETQDRAWFNIGKMRYSGKLYADTESSLSKIQDTLSKEREAEKNNMLANAHLRLNNYEAAYEALAKLQKEINWKTYAQYNMGVSLILSGKEAEGKKLLDEISLLKTNDVELKALKDKANLALGFAFIRLQKPQVATQYLEKVRLKGPLSAKALLGMGWALQQQGNLESALVPWMELQDWPVIDTAVQESLLAIPYTLEKMNRDKLALKYYQTAIKSYQDEITQLTKVLASVKTGDLMHVLRPAMITESTQVTEYRNALPDSISIPYLNHMLDSKDFQQVHKNYLELIYLRKNLLKWRNQFSAYYLMLSERKKYYKQQLAETRNDSRLGLIRKLKQQRNQLYNRYKTIIQSGDIKGLATEDEIDLLESLDFVEKKLKGLSKTGDYSEEIAKHRFLKGLVSWDIKTDYAPRTWKIKNELNQLDKAIDKAERSLQSLRKATVTAPRAFSGFDARIKDKQTRLEVLLEKVNDLIRKQQTMIVNQAIETLNQRKLQIETYHIRARYSLARLYDRLTLPGKKPGPAPAKVPAKEEKK